MPDLPSPRKPPRRFWLYAPYGLFLAVALGWSAAWLFISHQTATRMDQAAARLRAQGWTVAWSGRSIGGYPFRLNVRLEGARIAEPSGWSLAAPALEGEAYAFAPRHWVMVASKGVTLTRPGAGAVAVTGQALRASVNQAEDASVPQIAIEGWRISIAPQAGAKPLPVSSAGQFGLYLRPLAGDQAEFQLKLAAATPAPASLLARLSAGKPLSLVWDEQLTFASALRGRDWPSAVRTWTLTGGALSLVQGEVDTADVTLTAKSGRMTVDDFGRLAGTASLDLSHAGEASARLSGSSPTAPLAQAELTLKDGQILLGPFVIGKAPKIY